MAIKRFFVTALIAALLCLAGTPLAAADVPLPPAFTAELRLTHEDWGVYGALSRMTADMISIVPCYSMDGEVYIPEEYNVWQLNPEDPDLLGQQCFWPIESPLKQYLAEEIDRFYVKLQITYKDGVTLFTQAVLFERAGPAPLPEGYRVQAWYAAPIRNISYGPLSIRGQYHFTAPNTATPEELAALLPRTVPVELQISRDGDPIQHGAVTDYTVQWQDIPPGGESTQVLAARVTPPETCAVTIGTAVYLVKPPEILPENGPELRAAFHTVAPGAASQVLLSVDESTEVPGIRATFPQKPTGAVRVLPEYSLDGATGWTALDDVLGSAPLEEAPPRLESHTLRVLGSDAPPLAAYLRGEIPGFYLRLRVEGGALAGTTQGAAWPADYVYTPPRDDSNDGGSGGNGGNIGSDNAPGGSDENGGQRPNLPEETAPAPEPEVTPTPTPAPEPEPIPEPTPGPKPTPAPSPQPAPTPAPTPEPIPEPTPAPIPEPAPEPAPTIPAAAIPLTPEPAPEAIPEAVHEAIPEPLPERKSTIPAALVALALTVGGGIAVGIGVFSSRAAIKRFFKR